jgi:hypothetical protein
MEGKPDGRRSTPEPPLLARSGGSLAARQCVRCQGKTRRSAAIAYTPPLTRPYHGTCPPGMAAIEV